jgi:hypothetical protein
MMAPLKIKKRFEEHNGLHEATVLSHQPDKGSVTTPLAAKASDLVHYE